MMAPDRPRRILYLLPSSFYAAAHFGDRIRAAAERYEVHLAAPKGDDLSALGLPPQQRHIVPERRGLPKPWAEAGLYRRYTALIATIGPDLVHAVTVRPAILGGIAAGRAGLPAVLSVTGLGYAFGDSMLGRMLRPVAEGGYRRALAPGKAVAVFENPGDRDLFVHRGLAPADRTRVFVGGGIDLAAFPFVPESRSEWPLVIFASRLLVEKGVREFVAAARMLKQAGLAARFALVGEPDPGNPGSVDPRQLEAWAAEGAVEVWGFRPGMATVLAEAAAIALPSYYREGAPRILIEAAATGRAAVTTDMPGCRDVVADGETGLLVPPRDAVALAGAIGRLLADPAERARMGEAARRKAEAEFSSAVTVDRFMGLYAELLAADPRGPHTQSVRP